jgi:hypothetical protein
VKTLIALPDYITSAFRVQIILRRATMLLLLVAAALIAEVPARAATYDHTYTVTLATDANSEDTIASDAVYDIPGLGTGTQDTNDSTGDSGDLRWVINRAIIYGGTTEIVFNTATMISNGTCTALPCTITLSGPLPPLASLYGNSSSSTEVDYTNALSWYGSDSAMSRTAALNLTIDGGT